MTDPNNRPGGPNLILTAKSANKVQFFDAATLALTAEIAMPGSTHEMVRSLDGTRSTARSMAAAYSAKTRTPTAASPSSIWPQIARAHHRRRRRRRAAFGDDGRRRHALVRRPSLANAVLAIDPGNDEIERIDIGGAPHWIAISHATGKLFASFKTKEAVAVLDLEQRKRIDLITIPHGAEGIAVSPDGWALFVCAHRKGVVHAFDTRTHALHRTLAIEGAPGEANQLRRVRVSPDGRYVCVSSHVDNYAAVYDAFTLDQIAGFPTPQGADGLRLCRRRRARLSVLPRRRGDAGIRAGHRPRHARIRHRRRLRVHRLLLRTDSVQVFLAGAGGAIGRRLTPLLRAAGHEVTGTTRSADKAEALARFGAEPVVVDVFDAAGLERAVQAARPRAIIHQLTDLAFAPGTPQYEEGLARNARLRIEGTRNLVAAAKAAGVRRLIAQSIAFVYAPGPGARVETDPLDHAATGARKRTVDGVVALEAATLAMPEGIVLRYGLLYGPGTWFDRAGGPAGLACRCRGASRAAGAAQGAPASTMSPRMPRRCRARRPSASSASTRVFASMPLKRLAQERRALQPIAPGLLHRLGDADAHADGDLWRGLARPQFERRAVERQAVMLDGHAQRLA